MEIASTTDTEERAPLEQLLGDYGHHPEFDMLAVRRSAEALTAVGLGPADAAHVAFADAADAGFVTVDDRLLRRVRRAGLSIWIGTPMGSCEKENLK